MAEEERLQKLIAKAGLASRRAAEDLIRAGRVRVNGEVVREVGAKATDEDRIEVDGTTLRTEPLTHLILYKPIGTVTTTSDPQGRRTVLDLIGAKAGVRVFPVGRLDYDTAGVLLLTNDGELAYRLMHPRFGVEKVYEAVVTGVPTEGTVRRLREGVLLHERLTAPAVVNVIGSDGRTTRLRIQLHEGRNRQVRRMLEEVGHPVLKLTRTLYGGIGLTGLRPGQWRALTPAELAFLRRQGEPRG